MQMQERRYQFTLLLFSLHPSKIDFLAVALVMLFIDFLDKGLEISKLLVSH